LATALSVDVTNDGNGRVERIFGGSFTAGVPVLIALQVSPGRDASPYVVEEKLPDDWQIIWASHDGVGEDNVIRWGPFYDGAARTLTYRAVSGNSRSFFGTVSFGGSTSFVQDRRNPPGIIITRNSGGSTSVRFQSDGGRWVLECTDSLEDRVWKESSARYEIVKEREIILTDDTANTGKRFYRVRAAE
jgi:hypothetical protein